MSLLAAVAAVTSGRDERGSSCRAVRRCATAVGRLTLVAAVAMALLAGAVAVANSGTNDRRRGMQSAGGGQQVRTIGQGKGPSAATAGGVQAEAVPNSDASSRQHTQAQQQSVAEAQAAGGDAGQTQDEEYEDVRWLEVGTG